MPRPNPVFYPLECEMLTTGGFEIRRKIVDPKRYLVDLSLDQNALMSSLEQKWRYNLRQALTNDIEIRICETDADMKTFQSLYIAMVARKTFSSSTPVHLTAELNAGLLPKLRPRLILAYHKGRPLAGATIGVFGDTAYYMFGASAAEALPLKAGYALHWWIVRWLSEQGIHWYDLGGAAQDHGLRQFKKGLVGKRGTVILMDSEYDRWTQLSGRIAADLIYAMRGIQRIVRHGLSHARS